MRVDKKLGALLCVPEDHYELGNVSEPVVPEPFRIFGGELGQWGENFHDHDRYGMIIDASNDSHDESRAILNVHVGTLTIEEHPILIEEERLAVQLKQLYTQYCLLYENSAMFFLVSRLNTVIESLEDLLGQVGDYEDDEVQHRETMDMIEYLIHDIQESVPAIRNLRDTANSLTSSLYDTWKKIKEVRRKQEFHSTRVTLIPVIIKEKKQNKNILLYSFQYVHKYFPK